LNLCLVFDRRAMLMTRNRRKKPLDEASEKAAALGPSAFF
jgi:hypothetical protein